MNKLIVPYQMTCPPPPLSDSIRPRKKSRPLPQNILPTPTPSPAFTEFSLPSDIIQLARDEKIGNQESIRRWKKVAEGYKEQAERWKRRALDLAHSQERGIEALEDCWTNLRTTGVSKDGFPASHSGGSPVEIGLAGDDGSWACYVKSSRRCQMERRLKELGRQVNDLERTVERMRSESISKFDPYFGSIGGDVDVDVDDDDRLPTLFSPIIRHDVHRNGEMECTGFVDQLFPGLAITSHTVKDLEVVEGDIDVDDQIPPTPTSLFRDIFPDPNPVTISDSNSGPPWTLSLLSSGTRTTGTPFTHTHDPTDPTEIVHINQDLAPGFDSGLTSALQPLASGLTEPPLLDNPNPVGDDEVVPTSESRPDSHIGTFDSETRQGSSRSNRHQLQELGDWARNVLLVLEMEGNGVGEEIEHLEWTWELVKQFESCIDSQKSES